MRRLWKVSAICFLIVTLALQISAQAEEARNWLMLETTEGDRPVIVRALSAIPDEAMRKTMPWQLLVEWRYEQKNNGMPTENALQLAGGIEDSLFDAMRERGAVDLPLVRTGNGVRHWYYYVQDPKAIRESVRTFFERRPHLDVTIKAHKDEEWSELRRVISRVRH